MIYRNAYEIVYRRVDSIYKAYRNDNIVVWTFCETHPNFLVHETYNLKSYTIRWIWENSFDENFHVRKFFLPTDTKDKNFQCHVNLTINDNEQTKNSNYSYELAFIYVHDIECNKPNEYCDRISYHQLLATWHFSHLKYVDWFRELFHLMSKRYALKM